MTSRDLKPMHHVASGDDSLFIFAREPSERPMLSLAQRAELYAESGGMDVATGTGDAADDAPSEIKKLLSRAPPPPAAR